jgi:SAM-dependent methyltransferase
MWAETLGYRQCRLPFVPAFFAAIAKTVPLSRQDDVLDLGCGPGEVSLGIAPYGRATTGVDAEQPMLDELARRAKALGRGIRLVHARAEQAPLDLGRFKLITIGHAHSFMHHPGTFARLERWLVPGGRIVLCSAREASSEGWPGLLREIRRKWARNEIAVPRMTAAEFFAGTRFEADRVVSIPGRQSVDLDHLLRRAQAYSTSAPAVLGEEKTVAMLAELRAALSPFFRDGPITEDFTNEGQFYRRRGES